MCYHPDSTKERSRKIQQLARGHGAEAWLSWQARVALLPFLALTTRLPTLKCTSSQCPKVPTWSNRVSLLIVAYSPLRAFFSSSPFFPSLDCQTLTLFLESISLDPHDPPPGYCWPCVPFFRQTQEKQISKVTKLHDLGNNYSLHRSLSLLGTHATLHQHIYVYVKSFLDRKSIHLCTLSIVSSAYC